jgi:hypothetical protein
MDRSRRHTLMTWLTGFAAFYLRPRALFAQGQDPGLPPPVTRRDPAGRDPDSGLPTAASTRSVLEQRQKDIKKDVEKLFDLATELKTEVEKTDATTVLSLALLKKTEEIEKLAKQIRDHAKG